MHSMTPGVNDRSVRTGVIECKVRQNRHIPIYYNIIVSLCYVLNIFKIILVHIAKTRPKNIITARGFARYKLYKTE